MQSIFLLAELNFLLLVTFLFFSSCAPARYEAYTEKAFTVASWYGADFHGRPTSSGEIYNMYAHTCAHREFPFGTKLKVTNTANNKTIECVVNDRGPFVEGRDIDLSYAVAKELEVIGPGTSRVSLEVNGRDNSYIKQVKVQTTEKTGTFAIQVGSFVEGINAVRLKAALKLKYSNVYIQETGVKGTTYYRVRVGNYPLLDKAVSIANQLGQEGYQTVVVKADVKI